MPEGPDHFMETISVLWVLLLTICMSIIPTALNALYTSVYTAIVSTAGPAAAHIAASKAIEAFVIPISALEAALICVANALLEGLVTLIRELLLSMLENIDRFEDSLIVNLSNGERVLSDQVLLAVGRQPKTEGEG